MNKCYASSPMRLVQILMLVFLTILVTSCSPKKPNASLSKLNDLISRDIQYTNAEPEDLGKTICFKDEIETEPLSQSTYISHKYKNPSQYRMVLGKHSSSRAKFKEILRIQPGTSMNIVKAFDQTVSNESEENVRIFKYIEASNKEYHFIFHRSDYLQQEKYECQDNDGKYIVGAKGPVYGLDDQGNLVPKYNYDEVGNLVPIENK